MSEQAISTFSNISPASSSVKLEVDEKDESSAYLIKDLCQHQNEPPNSFNTDELKAEIKNVNNFAVSIDNTATDAIKYSVEVLNSRWDEIQSCEETYLKRKQDNCEYVIDLKTEEVSEAMDKSITTMAVEKAPDQMMKNFTDEIQLIEKTLLMKNAIEIIDNPGIEIFTENIGPMEVEATTLESDTPVKFSDEALNIHVDNENKFCEDTPSVRDTVKISMDDVTNCVVVKQEITQPVITKELTNKSNELLETSAFVNNNITLLHDTQLGVNPIIDKDSTNTNTNASTIDVGLTIKTDERVLKYRKFLSQLQATVLKDKCGVLNAGKKTCKKEDLIEKLVELFIENGFTERRRASKRERGWEEINGGPINFDCDTNPGDPQFVEALRKPQIAYDLEYALCRCGNYFPWPDDEQPWRVPRYRTCPSAGKCKQELYCIEALWLERKGKLSDVLYEMPSNKNIE